MNNPLVSVVMPAYNAEKFIEEAILSILSQTYTNLELIVVDDCSTDNTLRIIESISDSRIKLVKNRVNLGIASATNIALRKCKGKYIALMDDDDISFPERLIKQVSFLEKENMIDIVGGRSEVIGEQGDHISFASTPKNNPKYIKAMLLFHCLDFSNGTVMIRKSFIDKNNLFYKDGYYGMQDYQFFIECSKIGNISSIDDYVLKHRLHSDNTTKRIKEELNYDRAEAYKRMRKESLEKSGYILSESQFQVMDRILVEDKPSFKNAEDAEDLYQVFKEVINQAIKMKVEYITELNFFIKRYYTSVLYNSDFMFFQNTDSGEPT